MAPGQDPSKIEHREDKAASPQLQYDNAGYLRTAKKPSETPQTAQQTLTENEKIAEDACRELRRKLRPIENSNHESPDVTIARIYGRSPSDVCRHLALLADIGCVSTGTGERPDSQRPSNIDSLRSSGPDSCSGKRSETGAIFYPNDPYGGAWSHLWPRFH